MEALRARFRERCSQEVELFRRSLAADTPGDPSVEAAAHKLAGSAAVFGFADIGAAAGDIDAAFAAGRTPSREMLERLIASLAAVGAPGAGTGPTTRASPDGAGGAETILLVEDDDLLRAHAERELRRLGYEVIAAGSGDQALARLDDLPPFHLLFTDLRLPGAVGGEALAREIRLNRPQVRILFTSGRDGGEPGRNFLAKPYRRGVLAARVREVLDGPAAESRGYEDIMDTSNPPDTNVVLKDRVVLIIEDDAVMLRALGHAFQQAGCRVVGAREGEEGLARFLSQTPDLVITDILMPNREGVETIVAMKAAAPKVKILAISGGGRLGAEEVLDIARRLGADAILPKPFRSAEILAAARALLAPA